MTEERNSQVLQAIKAYGNNLLSFIRRRTKTEADAEDIMQDVWYQFSSVVNAEPIEQTSAWLYRVARNKITDKYKKRSESLLEDLFFGGDDEDDNAEPAYQSILLPADGTPETDYIRSLFWDELFAALEELPQEQREVFVQHELEDVSFAEMADSTGVNVQTLVSRKRYAVVHLRKRLKQLYHEISNY